MADFATMEAGPELDALIAEKAMGYHWHRWDNSSAFEYLIEADDDLGETSIARRRDGRLEPREYRGPSYSTDIAAAWQVAEAIERRGHDFSIGKSSDSYWCRFWADVGVEFVGANVDPRAGGPALAICRAALLAISSSAGAHPSGEPRNDPL